MLIRLLMVVVVLVALFVGAVWLVGQGFIGRSEEAGTPTASAIPPALVSARTKQQREDAVELGVSRPKQILFGDLHVHTTFSADAFTA